MMTGFDGVNALIIEDDPTSIKVLKSLLEALGVVVEVIEDSHWIVENIQIVSRPHVVFLDLEMPATNGYQVLDMLKGAPGFEGVKIVAYTTHTSHLNEARAAGFDGFLGKPLDKKSFPTQLAHILSGEPVWIVR